MPCLPFQGCITDEGSSRYLLHGGASYSECITYTKNFITAQRACPSIFGVKSSDWRDRRPKCNTKPTKIAGGKVRLLLARTPSKCAGVANALALLGQRYAGTGGEAASLLECDSSTGAIYANDEAGCTQAAQAFSATGKYKRKLPPPSPLSLELFVISRPLPCLCVLPRN